MEILSTVNKVPFDKLIHLFVKKCERCQYGFILPPLEGSGSVQIFDLEKGLQARFWECYFNEALETYNDVSAETGNKYFTLAFFLKTGDYNFVTGELFYRATPYGIRSLFQLPLRIKCVLPLTLTSVA